MTLVVRLKSRLKNGRTTVYPTKFSLNRPFREITDGYNVAADKKVAAQSTLYARRDSLGN
jgi:hypothetical protein